MFSLPSVGPLQAGSSFHTSNYCILVLRVLGLGKLDEAIEA